MIRRIDGVAGFFEDLPVLTFVLAGVSVLVVSGTWVAKAIDAGEAEADLEDRALETAEGVLGGCISNVGQTPRLSSLRDMNLSSSIPSGLGGHVVTIALLHPKFEVLSSSSAGDIGLATRTAFARVLFNAVDEKMRVCVLEVRVIVW